MIKCLRIISNISRKNPKAIISLFDRDVNVNITPVGEAKIRYVEPALCAGIIVWGTVDDIVKSYSPLSEFIKEKGLKCSDVGWREWTLYNDDTKSAIFLQKRVLEEE